MKNTVTILGPRGSIPVSGARFNRYGGSSTSFLVSLGGERIAVDAGSGILGIPLYEDCTSINLILTHAHVDHLLGLPMWSWSLSKDRTVNVWARTRSGLGARAQIESILSSPLWPIGVEELPAVFCFHELGETNQFGLVRVDTLEGRHPGGVSLLRFRCGDKIAVIMTDCTVTDDNLEQMIDFCRYADLLICDGQYTDSEFAVKSDYGHSTWTMAAKLASLAGVRQLRITHHDPGRTDWQLDEMDDTLRRLNPNFSFAREGEEVIL